VTKLKPCNVCGKPNPDGMFYAKGTTCKPCLLKRQRKRRALHNERKGRQRWYAEATGNKQPKPYSITIRFGSKWYTARDTYVFAIVHYISVLMLRKNTKAAKMLRYHLEHLPDCLPYELVVSGAEWPLVMSSLLRYGRDTAYDSHKRRVQNLYSWIRKKGTEARYEYEFSLGEGADS